MQKELPGPGVQAGWPPFQEGIFWEGKRPTKQETEQGFCVGGYGDVCYIKRTREGSLFSHRSFIY